MNRKTLLVGVVKPLLFAAGLAPLATLFWRGLNNTLGANPVETLSHETGLWALRLLLLTLAMTPLRRITGWPEWMRMRRMMGLYSFLYATLHVLVYLWLDQEFRFTAILEDVTERPYITAGALTFLMLLPLAATSFNQAIRWLGGKRWIRLHRLVYPCGLGAVIHYLWLVKADLTPPLTYLVILLTLLAFRIPPSFLQKLRGYFAGKVETKYERYQT